MKRKPLFLKLLVACSAIVGFATLASATGSIEPITPGGSYPGGHYPGGSNPPTPVVPTEPIYLVYQDTESLWNVSPPGGYAIPSFADPEMGPGYYIHTVNVAGEQPLALAQVYFYNPTLNSWWSASPNMWVPDLTYYPISDPTGGLITPASPPFNTNPGGGGGGENEGDYNDGYQEGYRSGYEEGFEQGIEEVLSDPEAYGLVSVRNIPSIKVAARRGTKLSISLTGNWNRYAASGVPSGWRFDRRSGTLSGAMGRNGTLTIRSSRGSASAAPIRIQLQSTAR